MLTSAAAQRAVKLVRTLLQSRVLLLCGALLPCSWPTVARGNGRFPTADHLSVAPGDARHLVMRTTFGILTSTDAGVSFRWVCESALGYSGQIDPSVELDGQGDTTVGYRGSLLRSSDDGCSWDVAGDGFDEADVVDLVTDPNQPETVLVLARDWVTGQVTVGRLGRARLEWLTSPGDDFYPATIEVAASDPERIYISGLDHSARSVLYRSDDGGERWQRMEIDPHPNEPAYVSAVDPNDADRLYVRVDGETIDALLVSDDGGGSFREVLTVEAELLGFALSPDGQRLAAGGPGVGVRLAEADELLFRQANQTVRYLTCLRWSELGLFACAREAEDGWTVARSDDAGDSFQPLFHMTDLRPRECDAGSITESRCSLAWQDVAPTLGIPLEPMDPGPEPTVSPKKKSSSCRSATGRAQEPTRSAGYGAVLGLALVGLVRRARRAPGHRQSVSASDPQPLMGVRTG